MAFLEAAMKDMEVSIKSNCAKKEAETSFSLELLDVGPF